MSGDDIQDSMNNKHVGYQARLSGEVDGVGIDILPFWETKIPKKPTRQERRKISTSRQEWILPILSGVRRNKIPQQLARNGQEKNFSVNFGTSSEK